VWCLGAAIQTTLDSGFCVPEFYNWLKKLRFYEALLAESEHEDRGVGIQPSVVDPLSIYRVTAIHTAIEAIKKIPTRLFEGSGVCVKIFTSRLKVADGIWLCDSAILGNVKGFGVCHEELGPLFSMEDPVEAVKWIGAYRGLIDHGDPLPDWINSK
jgi:hypothetical protein